MKLQDVEFGISLKGEIKMRNKRERADSINITNDFMITLINYMQLSDDKAIKWEFVRKNGTKDVLEIRYKCIEK